jgi:hypothetical protein
MKIVVIKLQKEMGGMVILQLLHLHLPPPLPQPPPNFQKEHGKIPLQTPLLKIDIKFELPMYNEEVNVDKLDNWIFQIEEYCRIQSIKDDETKIQLASLRLESATLI